jgi:hypothetical protein
MEYDLLKVRPKLQNIVDTTNLDIDDVIATVDSKHLSNLIGFVSEVDLNEEMLGSFYKVQATGHKSRSSSIKKPKKGSKFTKL